MYTLYVTIYFLKQCQLLQNMHSQPPFHVVGAVGCGLQGSNASSSSSSCTAWLYVLMIPMLWARLRACSQIFLIFCNVSFTVAFPRSRLALAIRAWQTSITWVSIIGSAISFPHCTTLSTMTTPR